MSTSNLQTKNMNEAFASLITFFAKNPSKLIDLLKKEIGRGKKKGPLCEIPTKKFTGLAEILKGVPKESLVSLFEENCEPAEPFTSERAAELGSIFMGPTSFQRTAKLFDQLLELHKTGKLGKRRSVEAVAREIFDRFAVNYESGPGKRDGWNVLYKLSLKTAVEPYSYQAMRFPYGAVLKIDSNAPDKTYHVTVKYRNARKEAALHLVTPYAFLEAIDPETKNILYRAILVEVDGNKTRDKNILYHVTTFVAEGKKAGDIGKLKEDDPGVKVTPLENQKTYILQELPFGSDAPRVAYDMDETIIPRIERYVQMLRAKGILGKGDPHGVRSPDSLRETLKPDWIKYYTEVPLGTPLPEYLMPKAEWTWTNVELTKPVVLQRFIAGVLSSSGEKFFVVTSRQKKKDNKIEKTLQEIIQNTADLVTDIYDVPPTTVVFSMQEISTYDKRIQGNDKAKRAESLTRRGAGDTRPLYFFDDNKETVDGVREEMVNTFHVNGTNPPIFGVAGSGIHLPIITIGGPICAGKSQIIAFLIFLILNETPFTPDDIISESIDKILNGKWCGPPYVVAQNRCRPNKLNFIDTTLSTGMAPWSDWKCTFFLDFTSAPETMFLSSMITMIARKGIEINHGIVLSEHFSPEICDLFEKQVQPTPLPNRVGVPGTDNNQTLYDLVNELFLKSGFQGSKEWFWENKKCEYTILEYPDGSYSVTIHYLDAFKDHETLYGVQSRGATYVYLPWEKNKGLQFVLGGMPLTVEVAFNEGKWRPNLRPDLTEDINQIHAGGFGPDVPLGSLMNKPDGQLVRFAVHSTETSIGKWIHARALEKDHLRPIQIALDAAGYEVGITITSRKPLHTSDEGVLDRIGESIAITIRKMEEYYGDTLVPPTLPLKEMTTIDVFEKYVSPYVVHVLMPYIKRAGINFPVAFGFEAVTPNAATEKDPVPQPGLAAHVDREHSGLFFLGMNDLGTTAGNPGEWNWTPYPYLAEIANNAPIEKGEWPLTTPTWILTNSPKEVFERIQNAWENPTKNGFIEELSRLPFKGPAHQMAIVSPEGYVYVTPKGNILKIKTRMYYDNHIENLIGASPEKLAAIASHLEKRKWISEFFWVSQRYLGSKKINISKVSPVLVKIFESQVVTRIMNKEFYEKVGAKSHDSLLLKKGRDLLMQFFGQPGAASGDSKVGPSKRWAITVIINEISGYVDNDPPIESETITHLKSLIRVYENYGQHGQATVSRLIPYLIRELPLDMNAIEEFASRQTRPFNKAVHSDAMNVFVGPYRR